MVHNTYPEPEKYPKMIWSTNYTRLACQVIFTLFFAGKDFAPKAIIDGKNIQDYLQDHFIGACRHLRSADTRSWRLGERCHHWRGEYERAKPWFSGLARPVNDTQRTKVAERIVPNGMAGYIDRFG
jgi:hypothetical protein